MRDPYLYPHSDILKNKAGIKNVELLKQMESDLTAVRLAQLISSSDFFPCTFQGLCQVHHYIFQDIYDWAGKPRTINIEKSEEALGGLSVEYADYQNIIKEADDILKKMDGYGWNSASFYDSVKNFSTFLTELWKVHPFREGNTRSVVIFCGKILDEKGIRIENALFQKYAAYMRKALVAASAVFHDIGDLRKPEYLERIVADAMKAGWENRENVSVRERLNRNRAILEEKGKAEYKDKKEKMIKREQR